MTNNFIVRIIKRPLVKNSGERNSDTGLVAN